MKTDETAMTAGEVSRAERLRKRFWIVTPIVAAMLAAVGTFAYKAATSDNTPILGSDQGTFHSPGPCEGDGVQVVISGAGKATRIGSYTFAATECFHPKTGVFAGVPTFTATNGDTMTGRYSGTVGKTDDPNVITYSEELVITGGTGRFAKSRERIHVTGRANMKTGEYSQTLSQSPSQ